MPCACRAPARSRGCVISVPTTPPGGHAAPLVVARDDVTAARRRRRRGPCASTITRRSPSPSSAMPMCASCSHHLAGEVRRMRRADAGVDVEAVGRDADRDHLGARARGTRAARRGSRRRARSRPRCASRAGRARWERCSCRTRCSARPRPRCGAPCRAPPRARTRAARPCARSIASSTSSGSFVAVRGEELDAVVVERIVRGADHDPRRTGAAPA